MSMSWEFIDLVMTGPKERNPHAQIKQEYQIKQSQFSKGQKKKIKITLAKNNTKKVYKVQTKHKIAPTRINIVKVLYTNSPQRGKMQTSSK